jgi:hypothetical protein
VLETIFAILPVAIVVPVLDYAYRIIDIRGTNASNFTWACHNGFVRELGANPALEIGFVIVYRWRNGITWLGLELTRSSIV